MPLIQAGGRQVHIQELGDGPLLVLVHPMGDTLATWYFTVAAFLAGSFRVLLYDLRGHGLTEYASDGYDLATLSGDLRALLEAAVGPAPVPVRVGGYSSGATLALRFAALFPEWVHSLALIDGLMPPYRSREMAMEEGIDPVAALDDVPSEEAEVRRGSRREDRRNNFLARLKTQTTFLDDFEAEESFDDQLGVVVQRTLLLYGKESPFLDVGQRLSSLLSGGDLQVIPGSHQLPLEQRDLVAERMSTFFS